MQIRLALLALAFVILGVPASAGGNELVRLPTHPDDVPWPTRAWRVGELPEELDRAVFDEQIASLFGPRGRGDLPDTRALLVVRGGRIVYERYADGFSPDSRFQSWSMAKSVTNAFVGTLVGAGKLELDERASVSEWAAETDPRREITLRHLLQMRSGLDNADGFEGTGDMSSAFITEILFGAGSRAPAAYAANVPLIHDVGNHWAYSTGTSILLARIAGNRVGTGEASTLEYLQAAVFHPIGMRSAQPEFAASGVFLGGAFVHATARDWARFGYLYLRDGVWDGRRLLPEGWVDMSRTSSPTDNNRSYGAHFWLNAKPAEGQWQLLPDAPESTFAAEGAYFQMVAIVPTKDLVAVRLGEAQATAYPAIKVPFGRLIGAFPDITGGEASLP